jgi:uncharacterized membrane protein YhaH (DUF805 family)
MAQTCPRCGLINPVAASRYGRIGRATFWLRFALPYLGGYVVLLLADNMMGTADEKGDIGLLSGVFLLVAVYPYLMGCVKRCHDRDKSGLFLFISLLPVLNQMAGTPALPSA